MTTTPADTVPTSGVSSGSGTEVVWRMRGAHKELMALVGRVIPMDRMVGKDFEKCLARLRTVCKAA